MIPESLHAFSKVLITFSNVSFNKSSSVSSLEIASSMESFSVFWCFKWMEDALQRSPKCPISQKKVPVSGQVEGFTCHNKHFIHSSRIISFYNNGSPRKKKKTRDHVSRETPLRPISEYILNCNQMATEKPRIKKPRNSLCKQLTMRRRRSTIRSCFFAFM